MEESYEKGVKCKYRNPIVAKEIPANISNPGKS